MNRTATVRNMLYVSVASMMLLVLSFLLLAGRSPASGGCPGVILIIIDTLRADHMGCHGYSRDTTPHIDQFAKGAVFFRNAISPSPWTSSTT